MSLEIAIGLGVLTLAHGEDSGCDSSKTGDTRSEPIGETSSTRLFRGILGGRSGGLRGNTIMHLLLIRIVHLLAPLLDTFIVQIVVTIAPNVEF